MLFQIWEHLIISLYTEKATFALVLSIASFLVYMPATSFLSSV